MEVRNRHVSPPQNCTTVDLGARQAKVSLIACHVFEIEDAVAAMAFGASIRPKTASTGIALPRRVFGYGL
jgi:hypothetical protein